VLIAKESELITKINLRTAELTNANQKYFQLQELLLNNQKENEHLAHKNKMLEH